MCKITKLKKNKGKITITFQSRASGELCLLVHSFDMDVVALEGTNYQCTFTVDSLLLATVLFPDVLFELCRLEPGRRKTSTHGPIVGLRCGSLTANCLQKYLV